MPRGYKFTYEYVKQYFLDYGCELLENKYIDCSFLMRYKCSCDNISKISFNHFYRGTRCRKCGNQNAGLLHRKYTINENYFKKIDTKNKAYNLGYILADGNINLEKTKLSLGSIDLDILEFIKNELQTTAPIRKRLYNRKNKNYTDYRLVIHNTHITSSLIKLNIVPRKTYCKITPNKDHVPEHLRSAFLLGMTDGDGCIEIHNKQDKSMCTTWSLISYYKENLESIQKLCDLYSGKIYPKNNGRISRWMIYKQSDLLHLYHYFYDDPPDFYLQRKKDKFDKIINYINRHTMNESPSNQSIEFPINPTN